MMSGGLAKGESFHPDHARIMMTEKHIRDQLLHLQSGVRGVCNHIQLFDPVLNTKCRTNHNVLHSPSLR